MIKMTKRGRETISFKSLVIAIFIKMKAYNQKMGKKLEAAASKYQQQGNAFLSKEEVVELSMQPKNVVVHACVPPLSLQLPTLPPPYQGWLLRVAERQAGWARRAR